MKDQVIGIIEQSLSALQSLGVLPEGDMPSPQVDHTRDPNHGDLATNVAMALAKRAGMPPRELAQALIDQLPANPIIIQCDIAGPRLPGVLRIPDRSCVRSVSKRPGERPFWQGPSWTCLPRHLHHRKPPFCEHLELSKIVVPEKARCEANRAALRSQ